MQDTLHFPTTTFPTKSPSFSRHLKPPSFLTLSSKTTTIPTTTTTTLHPPLKPISIPPQGDPSSWGDGDTDTDTDNPGVLNFIPNSNDNEQEHDFQEKALYLDSLGLDSLTTLPPSAIISSSSLHDLKALFSYLASLNFPPAELRRIVSMCPDILSLRLRDVAAVFTFLLREANVSAASLPYIIRRRPRLLVSNVESRLRPTMYFLQSIGIHDVHKHTGLLSGSVEDKFLPKIHYFEKIGFSHRDAVTMFRNFPPLFCYSVKENFEPKFNYFVVEMGRDLKELKEFPQYFSFSLERRIKPRHQCCVENGVCFPLPVMLKMKEDEFRERVDVCCNTSMPRSSSPLWTANSEL